MSLLIKPAGITKLSELTIDTNKNWLGYRIKNIGAAVGDADALRKVQAILQAMLTTHGDILYRDSLVAARLGPGIAGQYLKTLGEGSAPVWDDLPGGRFQRDLFLAIPEPIISLIAAEDHSGGANPITVPTLSIPAPPIIDKATATFSPGPVGGAIADDGGVQTDETTEANDAVANDMTLLPATPAVNDAYYFGLPSVWDWLCLNIGTAGVGTWSMVWDYWNGSTWASLPTAHDTSNGFRNGGYQSVTFTRPSDWATSTIMLLNLYWIRGRLSSYSSITTQPMGTQAWLGIH